MRLLGIILIIPFLIDFFIKAVNGFPSRGWWGIYKEGKLYCPEGKIVSLPQLIMKISRGIKEPHLVMVLIGVEAVFGMLAILVYLKITNYWRVRMFDSKKDGI